MINKIFKNSTVELVTISSYPHSLVWCDALGIGYLPSNGYEYGMKYWKHYVECSNTEFGKKLTDLRVTFTKDNGVKSSEVCDVGVGAGQFVSAMGCKGTDINPFAVEWLKKNNAYTTDLKNFRSLTLWDVIEHIDDPTDLLANVENVVMSTPIYANLASCLLSKHFKPGEHIWYFTQEGVNNFMRVFGFVQTNSSDFETVLGRDKIFSYCFSRLTSPPTSVIL